MILYLDNHMQGRRRDKSSSPVILIAGVMTVCLEKRQNDTKGDILLSTGNPILCSRGK